MKRKGVIYILTNPAFPQYVKIGYAQDLETRLKQLNRSETIPDAFRASAVYDVESELTDKDLHAIIDSINPDLRTIENFDGKKRVKEFYAMSAEDAYHLLECIAKISGTIDRLKRMKPEGHEIEDENTAREVQEAARRGPFRFSMCGICVGEEVVFVDDENKKAVVVDDRHIRFEMKLLRFLSVQSVCWGPSILFRGHCILNTRAKCLMRFARSESKIEVVA